MSHFTVNATRPVIFYVLSIAALCAFGFALNQNLLVMEYSLQFAYKKQAALALFVVGGLLGVFAMLKNSRRSERPWQTSRGQVNTLFAMFMAVTFVAILLTK